MLDRLGDWTTPLLVVPIFALLTISTANRINGERTLMAHLGNWRESRRLRELRRAMTLLYAGIISNAAGGLIGEVFYLYPAVASPVKLSMTAFAVILLIVASTLLFFEGFKPYDN